MHISHGQDNTQLLYATSSFMRQKSWGVYNAYLSKEKQGDI